SSMPTSTALRVADLSDYEKHKMHEAFSALDVVLDGSQMPIKKRATTYYEAFQSGEHTVKMVIKFCKRMYAFAILNNDKQMAILKPFCFDILLIRFAIVVNLESRSWPALKVKLVFSFFNFII